jgi:plasmid replication initiation protein
MFVKKNMDENRLKLPRSVDELLLIQPNNVTFGQYSLTPTQENVMTLIIDALQKHMTNNKELPRDLFNSPYVEVVCDEAGGENNKSNVKKAIREMYKKQFRFKWVHPKIHKTIESEGVIVTGMHDIKGTNRVVVNFNVWAIPFLVYYGVGVGGTTFDKAIALSIRGEYAKRIYKMICRWKDKGSFEYPISQLIDDLEIPQSYDNARLDAKILRPAMKKIKESGSDVWFEYRLICKKPIKGRKPKADTILYIIKTKHPKEVGGEQYQKYAYVYHWLSRIWDRMKSSKAQELADKINEIGELEKVYNRLTYYDNKIETGEKTVEHVKNSIKKMLRDEYGLE